MSFHAILILGIRMLLCRVRYACYTIQYSCLDIELHGRVTWPWVGRPLDKVCGLKIIGGLKHAPFWDADGNGKWTFRVLGNYCLPGGKKYLVIWMRLCEGELKEKTAHFRFLSEPQKRACLSPLLHVVSPSFQMFQVTQWWWIKVPLGKHLRKTRRPHFVAWQSNC